MVTEEDKKLGRFLEGMGLLTQAQLAEALKHKQSHNDELTQILVTRGLVSSRALCAAFADYLNIPFVDLDDYAIDPAVIELVPRALAEKHRVFPLFRIGNSLTITMANPGDVQVIDLLHRHTGLDIEPSVSQESDILRAINNHYDDTIDLNDSFDEVIQKADQQPTTRQQKSSIEKLRELSPETPAVKLVDLIIAQAVLDRASDIHIEPEESCLRIRYRIDGVLHECLSPPKNLQSAMISRIKILAELDIAETRTPQDGRFQMTAGGRKIDLRVSTLPTVYGENVVLRILDKSSLVLNLEDLGMSEETFQRFERILSHSYGVILVSGPTGSGKTTTLYSALNTINTPEKKIVTIEDPVEYRLPRIRQCQVNVKAGLTFAAGLRSILRQDPDIIMVGEIRDFETAKIAVESALTGHLVLSTIHTNDAPGGLTRLTEMGIEPFLTASATIAIIAQRLVKRICEECKEEYAPNSALLESVGLPANQPVPFYRGAGCHKCRNTGYRGRSGIYEIMNMDEHIRNLLLQNVSSTNIKQVALERGMLTLRQDALRKARHGDTSLEEVFRVTDPD